MMDIAQGLRLTYLAMIHPCDCSTIRFGKGASPALDSLLQLTPVVMLARTDAGLCSDNRHLETPISFGQLEVYSS